MTSKIQMTKFRDLQIGDTFDFIHPETCRTTYFDRCAKISARKYHSIERGRTGHLPNEMEVGSINVEVYNVKRGTR